MFPDLKIVISDAPEANSLFWVLKKDEAEKFTIRLFHYETVDSKGIVYKHGFGSEETPSF